MGEGVVGGTFLLEQGVHLLLDAVAPMGDVHVEGVVTADLLVGPLPPLVERLHQAAARLRDHMVHCGGGVGGRGGEGEGSGEREV